MNILITGGNGMIGAEITNYLSKKIGHENLLKIKTVFEYALIAFIVYFVFF